MGKPNVNTWDGAKTAKGANHSPDLKITGVKVMPNHGGTQQASSKGVKYKGVSTGYC